MSKKSERTAADEAQYVAHLIREEPIKTEVIVELREQNERMRENQRNLLHQVIDYGDLLVAAITALRVYRVNALKSTEREMEDGSDCVPFCGKHIWDTCDGWHRVDKDGQDK